MRKNRSDIFKSVALRTNLDKQTVKRIVEEFLEEISEDVSKGDIVQLNGFGTFELKARAARKGMNPKTGEKIDIPECKIPIFRPAKLFLKKRDRD